MRKKLFAVAMGAVLSSSFLMADIDDINPERGPYPFLEKIIRMAENGDMSVIDYYSEATPPSAAGLPLTQEELKEVFFQNHDWKFPKTNALILPDFREDSVDGEIYICPLNYRCNFQLDPDGKSVGEPVIIVVENGKYRIKSMPKQVGACEKEIKDGSINF